MSGSARTPPDQRPDTGVREVQPPPDVRPDTADSTEAWNLGWLGRAWALLYGEVSMIRDTSGQDRPLTKSAHGRSWRRWLPAGLVAVAVLIGLGLIARRWMGAERSVDAARLRIAKVERGTLVRDVVADGRVVAATAPSLYAVAARAV